MAERDFKAATDPCSFCGESASRRKAMARTSWSTSQICDTCLGLCCAILAEEVGDDIDTLAESSTAIPLETLESILARVKASAVPPASTAKAAALGITFDCSFCGAPRANVAKLISGPRVFICETCVADAIRFTQRWSG